MLQRLGLLWRGLRWRLGTSALLLLVATVAVFAATSTWVQLMAPSSMAL